MLQNTKDLDFEIRRKLFHLCALIFPFIYLFLSKVSMCIFMTFITVLVYYIDTYKHQNERIKAFVEKYFARLLREQEKEQGVLRSGASYMFAGLLLSCLLFSKGLAINSWLVLIVSDSVAAIVGMKFGTRQIYHDKTFEGTGAFFLSAVLVSVMSYFWVPHYTGFAVIVISCLITSFVEFLSTDLQVNDNFAIPLTYGVCTILLNLIR